MQQIEMELVTEVTQKLKSAVKAKLSEIGAYVDEELPEYIMVLIANKKSKTQMDEHLSLFLGIHTQVFTGWLCEVLKKLESVQQTAVPVSDLAKQELTDELKKEHVNVQKKRNFTSDPSGPPKKIKLASKIIQDSKFAPDKKGSEFLRLSDVQMVHGILETVGDDDGEYLALREDYELDDMLDSEIKDTSLKVQSKIQHNSNSMLPSRHQANRNSNISLEVSIHSAPFASALAVAKQKKSGRPASKIEIVTKNCIQNNQKMENPGVASVVRVRPRPTLPVGMQANKKLLLKAVAEAQQSVTSTQSRSKPLTGVTQKSENDQRLKNVFPYAHQQINKPDDFNYNGVSSETLGIIVDEPKEHPKKRTVIEQISADRAPSPSFIVTLNGVSLNGFREHENKEVQSNEEGSVKKLGKCRYWPQCKNINCMFAHPNVFCQMFPNCRFGDKCLFIHPTCKYNAQCNKANCPYSHIPQTVEMSPHTSTVSKEVLCKKFPFCTNMQCMYVHPKPCKYGVKCSRADCIYYHPHLPNRQQLKWFATASTTKM